MNAHLFVAACIASSDLAGLGVVARSGDRGGDAAFPARGGAAAATSCAVRPRGRLRAKVPQAGGRLLLLEGPQRAHNVSFARASVVRSMSYMYNMLRSLLYVISSIGMFLQVAASPC